MKEELLKQLSEITELTKNGIVAGSELFQKETPILVEQLLRWKFATTLTWVIISVVLGIAGVILVKGIGERCKNSDYFSKISPFEPQGMPLFAILIVSPILFLCNIFTLIQIIVAPKIYLLEYLKGLL